MSADNIHKRIVKNKFIDKVIMVLTTAFISMPSFIMGTLMSEA